MRDEEKKSSARARALNEELEWIRSSPKGRQAKSKARIREFEALVSQQTSETRRQLELRIPSGPRLGDQVFEVKNIRKGFGEKLLINDLSCLVPPGAIVGIIGLTVPGNRLSSNAHW